MTKMVALKSRRNDDDEIDDADGVGQIRRPQRRRRRRLPGRRESAIDAPSAAKWGVDDDNRDAASREAGMRETMMKRMKCSADGNRKRL